MGEIDIGPARRTGQTARRARCPKKHIFNIVTYEQVCREKIMNCYFLFRAGGAEATRGARTPSRADLPRGAAPVVFWMPAKAERQNDANRSPSPRAECRGGVGLRASPATGRRGDGPPARDRSRASVPRPAGMGSGAWDAAASRAGSAGRGRGREFPRNADPGRAAFRHRHSDSGSVCRAPFDFAQDRLRDAPLRGAPQGHGKLRPRPLS